MSPFGKKGSQKRAENTDCKKSMEQHFHQRMALKLISEHIICQISSGLIYIPTSPYCCVLLHALLTGIAKPFQCSFYFECQSLLSQDLNCQKLSVAVRCQCSNLVQLQKQSYGVLCQVNLVNLVVLNMGSANL